MCEKTEQWRGGRKARGNREKTKKKNERKMKERDQIKQVETTGQAGTPDRHTIQDTSGISGSQITQTHQTDRQTDSTDRQIRQ